MSKLQEIEKLLAGMPPEEKEQVIKLIIPDPKRLDLVLQFFRMSQDISQALQQDFRDTTEPIPGIESNPEICGGEPCIVRTRIPVWLLEQARRLGSTDEDLLKSYPTLRAEDLANAWAFVRSHREEIERQIRQNEEA